MSKSDFISYVGPPELHDGYIINYEQTDDHVVVLVRDYYDHDISLEFTGVADLKAVRAEGMVLYALAELAAAAPSRRFVFVNWEDEDDATLEIEAQDFRVVSRAESK